MIRNIDNFRHYQAKFHTWLSQNNYSNRSVKNYLFDVSLYLNLKSKEETMYEGFADLFSSRAIQSFVESVKTTGSSESTVNRRLAGIQLFLNFLIGEKVMAKNPIISVIPASSSVIPDLIGNPGTELDPRIREDDKGIDSDFGFRISDFKKHLVTSGLSKSTTGDYVADVMEFLEVVDPRIREDDRNAL